MGYGYGGHMMYGFGGWLVWIVILALVGWLIYYILIQQKKTPTSGSPGGENALEILRRRYATGEISKEEFEEIKKELQTPP